MARPVSGRVIHPALQPCRFRPQGGGETGEEVVLGLDELEALRLADLEGLYQQAAASRMGVSRQTFGRIVANARRKAADAIVNGRPLRVDGGSVVRRGFPGLSVAVVETAAGVVAEHFRDGEKLALFAVRDDMIESEVELPLCPDFASDLVARGVTHVVAGRFGPRAIQRFQAYGIVVCEEMAADPAAAAERVLARRPHTRTEEGTMKIAVVSDDGQTISAHFGRAAMYVVFAVEDGKATHREEREKIGHGHHAGGHGGNHDHHGAGGHGFGAEEQSHHVRMASPISDCEVLLARGMGMGAYEHLRQFGITPIVTDVASIDEAVQAYISGELTDHPERLH